jgi:hypothetical protein
LVFYFIVKKNLFISIILNQFLIHFLDACASLFWSIKRNVSYIDAWLDTSINYLRAENYSLARKCLTHTKWLAQKSARRVWATHGTRVIAQIDALTAGVRKIPSFHGL